MAKFKSTHRRAQLGDAWQLAATTAISRLSLLQRDSLGNRTKSREQLGIWAWSACLP